MGSYKSLMEISQRIDVKNRWEAKWGFANENMLWETIYGLNSSPLTIFPAKCLACSWLFHLTRYGQSLFGYIPDKDMTNRLSTMSNKWEGMMA